jgi:hypothetical protein
MTEIKDFINAAVNDMPIDAGKAFNELMNSRVETALDAREADLRNTIFNNPKDLEDGE